MFTLLKHCLSRVRAFIAARNMDGDFEQELESHLTMMTEDNVRRGMSPEQARRDALIRIGGATSLQERHRAVRGLPSIDAVVQDLRFAFRLIGKEPWFSAAAIVALSLGIGANTTGFGIVNAAFLRGLPVQDSDRLYVLSWQARQSFSGDLSLDELEEVRSQSRAFSGIAAYRTGTMNISDDRSLPEEVRGARITANTFGLLREQPILGRDFAVGDARPGAESVIIIGEGLWKKRFGGDPRALGAVLRFNGQPATIVGIMPEALKFPANTELWAPLLPGQARRDPRSLVVAFGLLKNGARRAEALAEMIGIAQRLAIAYPDTNRDFVGANVETFTERFVGGNAKVVFLVMMGAVSFVLVIACANVANLLLVRSTRRTREIAVRMAMGASRWRVVRQLLLESVVLGVIGGGLGLLLAQLAMSAIDASVQDPGKPYWISFTLDYVVFGYVAGICVLTGILFGLAPALQVSRTNVNDVLKDAGRGSVGTHRARWFSGTMVVVELALTIVLLAGAGLMLRSFANLYNLDVGFGTDHLMAMQLQLPDSKYRTPEARRLFYQQVEPRIAAISGVERIAVTNGVPPFGSGRQTLLEVEGRPTPASGEPPRGVAVVTISTGFFDVIGVPVARGRAFRESDGAPGSEVAVVNERLASMMFPGEHALGKRVRFQQFGPEPGTPPDPWRTIVGISRPIPHGSKQQFEPAPVVYLPSRQDPPLSASLLIRSALPPASVMDAVRREVQSIDRDQPVVTIQTLDQLLARDRWPYRVFGGLFGIFALIGLGLSAVGLYAVMAYSVTQRTQEIGVRMTLGADRRQVSWLVLKRGLVQLAIGLTLGLAGALALSRVMLSVLVQVTPTDPVTFAAITVLLTLVSIAACLQPARRATRVDPVVALRAE
jgi:putative ABC transport system permease protein